MYLRRHTKKHSGELYEYWTLVETVRTARGPRQRTVACLGKLSNEERTQAKGWSDLDSLLSDDEPEQLSLFEPPPPKESPPEPPPLWAQVDVTRVKVERVREFGRTYLGLMLWRKLGLHKALAEFQKAGKEEIGWDTIACVLTLGRFCGALSELSLAERWYDTTALEDLLGVPQEKLNESRLYRGLDKLLPFKDHLCSHLKERYQNWFKVGFEFLLYDVTSTFFEGLALKNEKAKRGYSRDSRPDCKQVCIGMVVTREGLPLGYEVFDGNRADVTTLKEMVRLMEEKYGVAERVWVFDRGITSEENLEFLRSRGAKYVVGTPKSQLKRHEASLLDDTNWESIQEGLEVKLVQGSQGVSERFILCRSMQRAAKERSMLETQVERLRRELTKIDEALRKEPSDEIERIERRIGRWLGRYTAAEKLFTIGVEKNSEGKAVGLKIIEHKEKREWVEKAFGSYLLRTNYTEGTASELWRWYIQLWQAEAAFRSTKTDLHLRPVFHQNTLRVEAHILVCFLSLALWRTLEMWMKARGLGSCARQFLEECEQLRMMDVVLPTSAGKKIRLRVVAQPEKHLQILLAQMKIELPSRPKIMSAIPELPTRL